MTNRTSSGSTALRMFAACFISSASTPRRPAVSTMTVSYCWSTAALIAFLATFTGSPTPLPGSGAKTCTPACSPTTWSCCTAFGRWRSAATSIGVWPSFLSHLPSLPASVVLPAPWRPASMMTVGGRFANSRRRCCPPRMPTSSSLTIWTTCCAGLSALFTSSESARSRMEAVKDLTTSSATSASRSARRISRTVPSTSDGDRRPLLRRLRKVSVSRSESEPNCAMIRRFYKATTDRPDRDHDRASTTGLPSGSCD